IIQLVFMKSRFKPMKQWVSAFVLMSIFCTGVVAAAKGPEIGFVDNKLSINAEAVPLGRLLQLLDRATGMTSKVPAELANRNISVKFSSLDVSDAVRKIFQGLPLDYVMIQGQGIIVTGASQSTAAADSFAPFSPPPAVQTFEPPVFQDFSQG